MTKEAVSVRLETDLLGRVDARAEAERRSRSFVIEEAIGAGLDALEVPSGVEVAKVALKAKGLPAGSGADIPLAPGRYAEPRADSYPSWMKTAPKVKK